MAEAGEQLALGGAAPAAPARRRRRGRSPVPPCERCGRELGSMPAWVVAPEGGARLRVCPLCARDFPGRRRQLGRGR